MTVGEQIRSVVERVSRGLNKDNAPFTVEPAELQHGDYATNIALVVAKALKKSPREVAQVVAEALQEEKSPIIAEVSVAGPGFINIRLSDTILRSIPARPGHSEVYEGRKTIVEYTDPNPFKEFHIGHLMSNTIGESISRLIESQGAETKRVC